MNQPAFINDVVDIIADFNEVYYEKSATTDYDIAIKGLWSITCDNLKILKVVIGSEKQTYAVACGIRLILECLTDARYLSKNKDEARDYWRNQEKIQQDLSSRENKWDAFVEGSVNRYGQLREKRTLDRIGKYMDDECLGDYNLMCFYTHPNIAALQWVNALGHMDISVLMLQRLAIYLNNWFDLLPNPAPEKLHMKYVARLLLEAANKHLQK